MREKPFKLLKSLKKRAGISSQESGKIFKYLTIIWLFNSIPLIRGSIETYLESNCYMTNVQLKSIGYIICMISNLLIEKGGDMEEKLNIESVKKIIQSINHEVSNPLNTISLNAQLLKRSNNEEILKRAAIIDSSVDRLKNIMYKLIESIEYRPNPLRDAKIIDLNKFRQKKLYRL